MDTLGWLELAPWIGASLLYELWRGLPNIFMCLDPTRIRAYFVDENRKEAFPRSQPEAVFLLEKFKALGMVELGIKAEKSPLWGETILELAIALPDQLAFVSIPIFAGRLMRSFYLYTPFSNGALVYTSTNQSFSNIESGQISLRKVEASTTPDQALASHQARVERFRAEGWTPLMRPTRESRLEATRLFYSAPEVRRMMRGKLASMIASYSLPVVLVVAIAAALLLFIR